MRVSKFRIGVHKLARQVAETKAELESLERKPYSISQSGEFFSERVRGYKAMALTIFAAEKIPESSYSRIAQIVDEYELGSYEAMSEAQFAQAAKGQPYRPLLT